MASVKYLADLDLSKNALLNASIQPLAVAPSDPVTGQVYFDTALSRIRVWNGQKWVDAGAPPAAGGPAEPTGPAGGALSGTYPAPSLAVGAVTNENVAEDAGIALSKLASDPSVRANHTGTQPVGSIEGFNEAVKAIADQSAAAVVAGAPEALDTLKELADALTEDRGAAASLTSRVGALEAKKTTYTAVYPTGVTMATFQHDLGSKFVHVDMFETGGQRVQPEVVVVDDNNVRVLINRAAMADQYTLRVSTVG